MTDDTRYLLDSILADWHQWARGYQHVASVGSSAMFNKAKSPRGYDSESEIADATIHNETMKTVDFHVSELKPDWRTAIQIHARNLATGRNVWTSARLPTDLQARATLLADARAALMGKLIAAGVV